MVDKSKTRSLGSGGKRRGQKGVGMKEEKMRNKDDVKKAKVRGRKKKGNV